MKLRNKETGKIVEVLTDWVEIETLDEDSNIDYKYTSLAELNEEWEDYDEPKEFYYITVDGYVTKSNALTKDFADDLISIGNYFETREEAEKAVEKLKAWKRLKEKGLKFHLEKYENNYVAVEANWGILKGDFSDVFILFGGEE